MPEEYNYMPEESYGVGALFSDIGALIYGGENNISQLSNI